MPERVAFRSGRDDRQGAFWSARHRAAPLQLIVCGPQVAPVGTSYAPYRLEANIRSTTVFSRMGAGGIGQNMLDWGDAFAFGQSRAIVFAVFRRGDGINLLSRLIGAADVGETLDPTGSREYENPMSSVGPVQQPYRRLWGLR